MRRICRGSLWASEADLKFCEYILVPDQNQWRATHRESWFATKVELRRYHQSLSPFARRASTPIREAVEFTRLAAKRWRYYSRTDPALVTKGAVELH